MRLATGAGLGEALNGVAAPIMATYVESLSARAVGSPAEILASFPALAARLLHYRGHLDQIATVVGRLRTEVAGGGRDHSNSLLLSPRDPLADREHEATPLLCLQLRRQLGTLHAAAVVLGTVDSALALAVHDLQRLIAAAARLPLGSATLISIDPTR